MDGCKINGFRRVSKPTARKFYEDGRVIYICPCLLKPGGAWRPEVAIVKGDLSTIKEDASFYSTTVRGFDKIVDEFMYYNCRGGSGRYPSFYIRES